MRLRYLYAIKMFLHHRKQIKNYVIDHKLSFSKITDISQEELIQNKIEVLILDFDGVLNSHGEINLKPEVEIWLNKIIFKLRNLKIFVLSNKPMPNRKKYFFKNFTNISFIKASQKKPYTDGLQEIQKITNCKKENMLLIDDRLMTGILAATLFGCKAYYITKPYTNFLKRPFTELFFYLLRSFEKILAKW